MGCPRISYVRRMHYATRGNRVRKIRTPGNKLKFQQIQKRSQGPHTPWVLGHKRLAGTKALNHFKNRNSETNAKTVSRAYGGVLSADQVRDRVIRAFLVEEQRIARRMDLDKKKYKKLKQRRNNKLKKKKSKTAGTAKKAAGAAGARVAVKKAAAGANKKGGKQQQQQQKGGKKEKKSVDSKAAKQSAPAPGAKLAAGDNKKKH